jgi:L-lactate dehydrogenase
LHYNLRSFILPGSNRDPAGNGAGRPRYANIAIIEGNQTSQFGIGMVSARIAEIVLRDERGVIPIGSYCPEYGVTLSMPSVLGQTGVVQILEPAMSQEERQAALQRSAETLKAAVARIQGG